MEKVRFACPRCHTIMQTGADKISYDVACPHCAHRFKLVESGKPASPMAGTGELSSGSTAKGFDDAPTIAPTNKPNQAFGVSQVPCPSQVPRPTAPVAQQPSIPVSNSNPYAATAQVLPPIVAPANTAFQCPYCQTTKPPLWKSEVSSVGWIVFAVLLVTTCFFCFIGLFIRDKYRQCSQCKIRLG